MNGGGHDQAPLAGVYSVKKQDFGRIRSYYGLRFLIFLVCAVICLTAVFPNGSLSEPETAAWLGIVLLLGFFFAFNFSKPALLASLALPRGGRSIAVWKALGVSTAIAYGASGWGYIDDDVAGLVMCVAGTAFFGVVLFSSMRMIFNPAIGGALIQIVDEHRSNKGKSLK